MATGRAANVGGAALSSSMQKAGLVTLTGSYATGTAFFGVWVGWNSPLDQPDPVLLFNPATSSFVIWSAVGSMASESIKHIPGP